MGETINSSTSFGIIRGWSRLKPLCHGAVLVFHEYPYKPKNKTRAQFISENR